MPYDYHDKSGQAPLRCLGIWCRTHFVSFAQSILYRGAGIDVVDAVAMYWGLTQLNLPVISPEEVLAQARAMQVADHPGEREFNEYLAKYLIARFDSLNKLASHYHSATDDIDGCNLPLNLADLQTELRIDEFDRTLPSAHR